MSARTVLAMWPPEVEIEGTAAGPQQRGKGGQRRIDLGVAYSVERTMFA
jgi:hypothetical protein